MNSIKIEGREVYPSKIVCIGRNYVEHIEELNNETPSEPVIFIKPNSSISDQICFDEDQAIHFEGEISFSIKSEELFGVGFGLDLTKREVQSSLKAKGLPWERAKSFDKSAVFSEFVKLEGPVSDLALKLYINDKLAQEASHELMLNKPENVLNEIKSFLSLEDDDLLMTGTPKGVGTIHVGDRFTGRIFSKQRLIVEQSWVVQ